MVNDADTAVTKEAGAITPTEPGSPVRRATTTATSAATAAGGTRTRSSRPGFSRTDTGAPSPGAIDGSSRAAKSITVAGTRNPRSSTSM